MAEWKDKRELETFLSSFVDEEVSVVEDKPCFIKSVPLTHFGLIGHAVIYRGAEGRLFAVLVPFRIPFGDQKSAA